MTQVVLKNKIDTAQDTAAQKIIITVDGPAASGKTTLGFKIAARLGYACLDTGTLYRAVGLAVLETGGNPALYADVAPALAIIKRNLTPELLASKALQSAEVADAASKVSAMGEVRLELLDMQRDFAHNPPGNVGGAVLIGRDTGTVVCPRATVKFFVTAAAEERAKRRLKDLQKSDKSMTYETVLADLKERDLRDTLRKISPTIPADDAQIIDTTEMTADAVVENVISAIRAKFLEETDV